MESAVIVTFILHRIKICQIPDFKSAFVFQGLQLFRQTSPSAMMCQ